MLPSPGTCLSEAQASQPPRPTSVVAVAEGWLLDRSSLCQRAATRAHLSLTYSITLILALRSFDSPLAKIGGAGGGPRGAFHARESVPSRCLIGWQRPNRVVRPAAPVLGARGTRSQEDQRDGQREENPTNYAFVPESARNARRSLSGATSTSISSPRANSPTRIFSERGSSTYFCTARFRGRAP